MASSSPPAAAPPTLRRARTTVPTTSSLLHGSHLGSAHELHYQRHLTAGTAAAGVSPLSIEQVGESHLDYTVRWRVHPWESLEAMTEFRSPTFHIDNLPWSLKVFKGRVHHPGALSLYLGCDGKMTGIHKRVRITFMVENAQNARMPGYSLVEQPVWFSSDHLTWGEENLCLLDQITSLIHVDTLALSVHIQILQTLSETPPQAPSPLTNLFANRAFADAVLRVSCEEDDPAVEIPIHRAVLASQSSYFSAMFFTSQFAESVRQYSTGPHGSPRSQTVSTSLPVIPIRGTDPGAFMHLISFMYRQPMHPPTVLEEDESAPGAHATGSALGHVEELIESLSLEELAVCLATAHMFQVPTWTELLLCAVRLLVNDVTVWRVWELGELYECDKTTTRAKRHVAANFSRICSSLVGRSSTRPGSVAGTATGLRSRYSTGQSSSSPSSATSTGLVHAPLITGIQWQQAGSTHLAAIPASRMRALLQMDPINCDSEEQMFELFSEWVMARFVKSSAYRASQPPSVGLYDPSRTTATRPVEGHDSNPHSTVTARPVGPSCRFSIADMSQALSSTSTPPPDATAPFPAVRIQRHLPLLPEATPVTPATSESSPTEDPHAVVADLIRFLRFPVIRKEYLVTRVEGADHLMCWPEVREMLRETYRALLVPDHADVEPSPNWVPRRRVEMGTWPDGQGGGQGGNRCTVT